MWSLLKFALLLGLCIGGALAETKKTSDNESSELESSNESSGEKLSSYPTLMPIKSERRRRLRGSSTRRRFSRYGLSEGRNSGGMTNVATTANPLAQLEQLQYVANFGNHLQQFKQLQSLSNAENLGNNLQQLRQLQYNTDALERADNLKNNLNDLNELQLNAEKLGRNNELGKNAVLKALPATLLAALAGSKATLAPAGVLAGTALTGTAAANSAATLALLAAMPNALGLTQLATNPLLAAAQAAQAGAAIPANVLAAYLSSVPLTIPSATNNILPATTVPLNSLLGTSPLVNPQAYLSQLLLQNYIQQLLASTSETPTTPAPVTTPAPTTAAPNRFSWWLPFSALLPGSNGARWQLVVDAPSSRNKEEETARSKTRSSGSVFSYLTSSRSTGRRRGKSLDSGEMDESEMEKLGMELPKMEESNMKLKSEEKMENGELVKNDMGINDATLSKAE